METIQDTNSGTSRKSPNSRKYVEVRSREHLLQEEVEAMREAINKKGGRHAHRDSTLILVMYRHGLRVEELTNLKWEQIDFASGNIHVRRIKRGIPSTQPLGGDEMRSLRRLKREYPTSPFVFQSSRKGSLANDTISGIIEKAGELAELPFPVHPHMLRHATGFYLANKGIDTRTIQAYLGHKNIQHTVRYTELAPGRFRGLWDD
ncbi:tyrosine-type recombinase/integrase [Phormidium tenue FACHB-886]|nr:tyrosine-type recombinase/integrase [Phormidium tenue FACHB-886]